MCAFSILLSLARRFWNQILICVSVRSSDSASSNLLGLEMYSLRWYSNSSRSVWSDVNVVRWRRCRASLRRRRATEIGMSDLFKRSVRGLSFPFSMPSAYERERERRLNDQGSEDLLFPHFRQCTANFMLGHKLLQNNATSTSTVLVLRMAHRK